MDLLLECCRKCDKLYPIDMLSKHSSACQGIVPKNKTEIPSAVISNVDNKNETDKKVKDYKVPKKNNIINIDELINILDEMQLKAFTWCVKKAKIYHKNVYENARIRFMSLGYTDDDLISTIKYVNNVDVIVHYGRATKAEWLATEDRLKNVFELQTTNDPILMNGYIAPRIDWENNLFNNAYSRDCVASKRVKYGCLNLLSDINGCNTAFSYGLSYFIMKPHIKSRVTFVCGDSSTKQPHICTFDHFVQLLLYVEEATLKNMIIVAKHNEKSTQPYILPSYALSYNYIEAHIHGDVYIDKDIQRVMIHRSQMDNNVINRLIKCDIPFTIFG